MKNSNIETLNLKNAKITILIVLAFFMCSQKSFPQNVNEEKQTGSRIQYRRSVDPFKPTPLISLAAVGDLMMSSWIIDVVKQEGVDFPFDSTRALLKKADLAIANLEAPLADVGKRYEDKTFTFKVPTNFIEGIKRSGLDVVNLANNHILDFGEDALASTISILDSNGIAFCGAGADKSIACAPTIVDHFGVKVAFLGFSMTFPKDFWAKRNSCGTCYPDEALLNRMITLAEEQADLTVVSFHWGAEKRATPKDYQIFFAHKAIDFGADLVLGHHPHVLQGLEVYKKKLIAYSLGNYVFGSFSNHAKDSMVLSVQFTSEGLLAASVHPISVHNATVNFQPRLYYGKKKQAVINYLNEISLELNKNSPVLNVNGNVVLE